MYVYQFTRQLAHGIPIVLVILFDKKIALKKPTNSEAPIRDRLHRGKVYGGKVMSGSVNYVCIDEVQYFF